MTTTNERGWVETDVDEAEKAYAEWGEGKERAVKPPPGKSTWWICPAMPGASQGAVPFLDGTYVHFIHDPRSPSTLLAVGICPTKTRNQPCSWCSFLSKVRKLGHMTDADIEYVEGEAGKEHVLCHAIRLDGDDDTLKVEFMDLPIGCYKTLNQILRDRRDGRDFTHPEKGAPVIFEREGKGLKTKYSVRLANPRPLPKEGMALLVERVGLDKVYGELDHEGLAAVANNALASFGGAPADPAAPTSRQIEGGK